MSDFYEFSFKNSNAIFGIHEITGWDEGDDAITITMETEQWVKRVGAKGDVLRAQTNNNSGEISVKLLQTSSSNTVLMGLYLADRESGAGALPFIVTNKEEGLTVICNNAWITKMPDIIRGAGPNVMEWTLHADFITPVPVGV